MELKREEIIKSLECCEQSNCKECPSRGNCHELHSYALALIKELIKENEGSKVLVDSYKIHCEKLSEEIFNAFKRGQKQATSRTVAKMRDRLRDIDEFYKYSDVRGELYYLDLQAWVREIEVGILEENK